jgi:altronate dehydratase
MKNAIQINEKDNVATVTSDISSGEKIEVLSSNGKVILKIIILEKIPFGHKIAIVDIKKDEKVVKYGEVIGVATRSMRLGDWVHTHNVESAAVPTSALKKEVV